MCRLLCVILRSQHHWGGNLQIPDGFYANLKIGKPVGLKSEDFTQLDSPS